MSELLRIVAVLALVAANAFFVIGEYAVVTARRAALSRRAEAGSAGARTALRLMDDPVRVISTVQVGITAVGILLGALAEPTVREIVGDGLPLWVTYLIAFALVTYLSVVLGELVPKALTLDRAETLAILVARPIELIAVALAPIVWVLQRSAGVLLRPFGIHEVVAGEAIRSSAELHALVQEVEGSGVLPRAQEELLHNVFDFADREAADIMVPALDVRWLDAGLTARAALDQVLDAPHGRYPVGRETLDHLEGVVHVRELLAGARRDAATTVGALARPVLAIPETKDVGALLRELRERREQLAVVLDEYGSVAGIVTLEDILEELVGEIQDEFDLPDARLARLDERTVRVAGSITVDDLNEELGLRLPENRARTLAGLVLDTLGRRPNVDDTVRIDDVAIKVETLDGLRVTGLRVTLPH